MSQLPPGLPGSRCFGYRRATPRIGSLILLWFALCALGAGTARAAAAPVPLIVDTDMFSDADDVGALATAYGLQNLREAKVIAVAVNTRTSRPSVAANSWKCVAAIDAFYGSASVPIGTAMPNDGSSAGDAGFAAPCAAKGSSSPPAPGDVVDVYRSALAGQPDGSVVIASVGYLGNLAALLRADPGLVARKVRTLVVMGGGYPRRNGETNVSGDPSSAQEVAATWPTKLVWSGFEVGAVVDTGQTISSEHPRASPVRAAYEAFAGAATAIKSWDLTAVYHAIRPDDGVLREVGPGRNTISSTGANAFTTGSGNQYYLELTSVSSLESRIETLLGTRDPLPPPPAPDPPPAPRTAAPAPAPIEQPAP